MDEEKDVDLDTSSETTEEVVENLDETVVSTESEEDKLAKLQEQNKRLFERAKKAEGFVKQADGTWVKKPKPTTSPVNQPSPVNTEASDPVYVANLANALKDLSKDEIEFAQTIAKGSGKTLFDAIQSDGFKVFHQVKADERRKEAAKLGASRGSSESSPESLVKPDMTREEHVALVNKVIQGKK